MRKRKQQAAQDIQAWLLDMEARHGCPVVVSLLVKQGTLEFMACVNHRHYFPRDEGEDEDQGKPLPLKTKLHTTQDDKIKPYYMG